MVAVMGDLNATVGSTKTCSRREGGGENGERLLDFCKMNVLMACNIVFAHKIIQVYLDFSG
jgi:hypothetical protein